MKKQSIATRLTRAVRSALSGDQDDFLAGEALTIQAAQALVDHHDPATLLPWLDMEDGYVQRTDGEHHQIGFGFFISPVLVAGKDMESQLEALISRAPDGTTIQFACHSSAAIDDRVAIWKSRRLRYNTRPILEELVNHRVNHMLAAAHGKSLVPHERYFPREVAYCIFVTLTFMGDPGNKRDIRDFDRTLREFQSSMEGYLSATGVAPSRMTTDGALRLCRRLCNPQMSPSRLDEVSLPAKEAPGAFAGACFEKQTRIRVGNGHLDFSDENRKVCAVPLTMDDYPDFLRLFMTGELIGKISSNDRIPNEFWLTTIIHKMNQEKIKDSLQMKMGLISKQCMSDSEWYRNMMPHLFKRRDDTALLINQTRKAHSVIKMLTACVIFTEKERINTDADYVCATWRKAGFRASPEKYIALPVWQTLLPWGYNANLDQANKGLQRGFMAQSVNGACAAICQGDWAGNGPVMRRAADGSSYPYANGMLLTARRGQMGCIDIFDSPTNYNFSIIATSGAGKSFFANEMIVDMLCRNGLVRVIDAGGSYRKLCQMLGGNELRFDPNHPFSLNPFWGLAKRALHNDDEGGSEIAEMTPMLKEVICQMAFPIHKPSNYEYQLVESAIIKGFDVGGEEMSTSHVYDQLFALGEAGDEEARRIAVQLHPFAYGRYAIWFNGKPEIDLSNPFTILELEELNNDKELRSVILTMVMALTTRDMYLQDRSIPKMMIIDEAWDLLGESGSGKFIETAFRRIRKYFGAAGIITQGFKDLEKSAAAEAAFDSCAWKFVLKQSGPSLEFAKESSKLGRNDDFFFEMLRGVQPGTGYSEVYVQGELGGGLFRFVTDRYSYYLFTTNAKDLTRIDQVKQEYGLDTAAAISKVVEMEEAG